VAAITQVSVSLTGVINDGSFTASGTLTVDSVAGTKQGVITTDLADAVFSVCPDGYAIPMPRCFVGAKPVHGQRLTNPVELLGRRFISRRTTNFGDGTLTHFEEATVAGGVLTSKQVVHGRVQHATVSKVSGVRERIEVRPPNQLHCVGRYVLELDGGGRIPVGYEQDYFSLSPNRRLFQANRKRKYLLTAEVRPVHEPGRVTITTVSTIT